MRTIPLLVRELMAGWILMTPPIDYDALKAWTTPTPWPKSFAPPEPALIPAPRSQRQNERAFDTAAGCEEARLQRASAGDSGSYGCDS